MKIIFSLLGLAFSAFIFVGCGTQSDGEMTVGDSTDVTAMYVANLEPLNANVTGMEASAQAKFILTKDSVFVTINARGVPPKIEHWQHFHGFIDNKDASCVAQNNDTNGDGIIDVTETEAVSGTTMVPFNKNPEDMNLGADTYPKAGDDSTYHYEVRIPLSKLKAAFAESFGDSSLNLDKRVLYIHGVPSDSNLPSSVESIEDIPAHVTLPIACGKIERVAQ